MSREVIVKTSWYERGVGSLPAHPIWESDPTEEGAVVRLDITSDGSLYMTFTDAEEFDGAYISVQITTDDLGRLLNTALIEGSKS